MNITRNFLSVHHFYILFKSSRLSMKSSDIVHHWHAATICQRSSIGFLWASRFLQARWFRLQAFLQSLPCSMDAHVKEMERSLATCSNSFRWDQAWEWEDGWWLRIQRMHPSAESFLYQRRGDHRTSTRCFLDVFSRIHLVSSNQWLPWWFLSSLADCFFLILNFREETSLIDVIFKHKLGILEMLSRLIPFISACFYMNSV